MNTKILMLASAIVMALAGLAASFLPHELLSALNAPSTGATPVLIQLLGALLIAFAMVNWMGKDSLIGGIYQRPVAIGNLLHFVTGALALAKFVIRGGAPTALIVAAVVYAVFAIAFAKIVFWSPVKRID